MCSRMSHIVIKLRLVTRKLSYSLLSLPLYLANLLVPTVANRYPFSPIPSLQSATIPLARRTSTTSPADITAESVATSSATHIPVSLSPWIRTPSSTLAPSSRELATTASRSTRFGTVRTTAKPPALLPLTQLVTHRPLPSLLDPVKVLASPRDLKLLPVYLEIGTGALFKEPRDLETETGDATYNT
jgi:hypothetical protein